MLVAAVCKFEGPAAGLRELRVSKSDNMQSVHAYTSVIHSHGVRSLSDVVSALVNEAENDHMLQPDIMLYDAAIRAQGRAGKVREAFAMFNTLREKGLEPTEGCFVGLVYACAHGGGGPELGKRAFVAWEAARWHGVAGKLVLGGVASVLLRWNLWNDPRVGRLVREMKACLQRKQQWRTGEAERFEQKLADLERLGGWGEIPDEDKDATAEER